MWQQTSKTSPKAQTPSSALHTPAQVVQDVACQAAAAVLTSKFSSGVASQLNTECNAPTRISSTYIIRITGVLVTTYQTAHADAFPQGFDRCHALNHKPQAHLCTPRPSYPRRSLPSSCSCTCFPTQESPRTSVHRMHLQHAETSASKQL
jgi:hypothetical protein